MASKTLGDRLFDAREVFSLTQIQAAELIGVSLRSLQGHEKNEHRPGNNVLNRYIKVYKCDKHWLLTGEGDSYRKPIRGSQAVIASIDGDDGEKDLDGDHRGDTHGSNKYNLGQKKIFHVRSPDPDYEYGPRRAYTVHEALLMATRVLESDTSYADALYLNIQHFDRAIQAEERLSIIEDENKHQLDRIVSLEDECEKFKKRIEDLENKIKAPDGALKESTAT